MAKLACALYSEKRLIRFVCVCVDMRATNNVARNLVPRPVKRRGMLVQHETRFGRCA